MLLAAALLLPGLAAAQPAPVAARPLLPGIGATDPRRPVDLAQAPWRALGRVQLELGKRCSGALVGPRTVLTAAHCLVAPRTGNLVRPETVHFLLAYDRGARPVMPAPSPIRWRPATARPSRGRGAPTGRC